jgi:hypothetical protein
MTDLPEVVGDSDGMRALASALRQTAASVSSCDSSAWPKVATLTFTGPAAGNLQAALSVWHGDVTSAANTLSDAADLLVRAAAQVDADRAARARLEQQLLARQHEER